MTPFARALADEIAARGPIPLSGWMARCNDHYYSTRDPLGRDFTTAPEISQTFGELIGVWAADLWARAGAPRRVLLVEVGPGRGTLMADALSATRRVPGFHAAAEAHLVETSTVLAAAQRARLAGAAVRTAWHARLADVPRGAPLVVIANELLDALPVTQSVRAVDGWRERSIGWGDHGFAFVDGAHVAGPAGFADAPAGAVHERSEAATALVTEASARIAAAGGAALFIDYGHVAPALGDTLQAVRGGERVPPLAFPGDSDLTCHVDFAAMADAARAPVRVHAPVTQAQLLARLGLAERTHALARANPAHAAALHAGAARLTHPTQMGALFHALALTHPDWPPPAGFA